MKMKNRTGYIKMSGNFVNIGKYKEEKDIKTIYDKTN